MSEQSGELVTEILQFLYRELDVAELPDEVSEIAALTLVLIGVDAALEMVHQSPEWAMGLRALLNQSVSASEHLVEVVGRVTRIPIEISQ